MVVPYQTLGPPEANKLEFTNEPVAQLVCMVGLMGDELTQQRPSLPCGSPRLPCVTEEWHRGGGVGEGKGMGL